jgi:hypothetical protein
VGRSVLAYFVLLWWQGTLDHTWTIFQESKNSIFTTKTFFLQKTFWSYTIAFFDENENFWGKIKTPDLFNPRKHFTFFAAESDILGVENDKKSEVLFIQFLCFIKGKLKINGFF